MASTIGPSPPSDHLSLESIPTVDLRLLSQSELTALSLCSSHAFDLRRCDDVVIPKIDRSVFNESAGSRKQTYSRLRLAPRNSTATSTTTNGGNTPKPRNPALSPLDSDNSRIISLFKALFNGENIDNEKVDVSVSSSALVPVNVEYSDAFLCGADGGERKRKRGRKPKSETTTAAATTTTLAVATTVALAVEEEDEEENKRKKEERERELVNRNGEVVDLAELAKEEDPYGEEIRKRTQGREDPEELLGFISDLNGQWGSRRKKRKIVDANEFGDVLPNGWKVLIAMKKKQGRAWVFCRRYISPNGRYFVSCKEVSSYLLSLISPEDLKPQTAVEWPENSVVHNMFPSENATASGTKIEYPSLCVTPLPNEHNNLLKPLTTSTSQSIDHDKQLTLFTKVHSGEVQATSALKCHKCSTAFNEKDELLNHLISCHKRKRRKCGAPVEDDIVMKNGKYECQFCNKVFHERSSYFGHVGIHVKNYVKNIGASPGLTMTSKQNISAVSGAEVPATVSVEVPARVSVDEAPAKFSVDEVPVTVSETLGNVEMNSVSNASALNTLDSSELNINSAETKPEVVCEAETHLGHGKIDQNHLALHAELITGAEQNNDIAADECSDKHDGPGDTTDKNVREVEEAVDFTAMKPDSFSGSEEVCNSENNDLCGDLGEINATKCLGSEISKASAELLENKESCFLSDSKQIDLENGEHFGANSPQREIVASESDLCAENKENSSGDQNFENRSLENNTVKHSCFTEGLEIGDEERLIDCSESGHLDVGIDAADDVQHHGSLDECSNALLKEEETCDTTASKIELIESPPTILNENDSLSEDQPTTMVGNYIGKDFVGMVSEAEVDMCSLGGTETTVDADRCIAEERSESYMALLPKDNGCDYIVNEAKTIPHIEMVEPKETGVFEVEQTGSLGEFPKELSNRKVEEPKRDQVINSSNLFFTSGSNGTCLPANVITNNDHARSDVSNVLGAFNNFVEDKQEQIPKSILSGLSINEHLHEAAMNNVTDISSTTTSTELPEIDKMGGARFNKLIFDFGNITEINARFLGSVENEAAPDGTSPFSLWGQQTCTIEDNQTRVYDGARGVAQQERASNSTNSLDLVGLQQSSNVGYNLNEVCIYEQKYGVQHNETGVYRENNDVRREGIYSGSRGIDQQERTPDNNSFNLVGLQQSTHAEFNLNKTHMNEQRYSVQPDESGVYSKINESRREGISHCNTLNLAGCQQQCDPGYNLNKPCINQQSYGMNCNETGAYSTSNESNQDRVTYRNSLSLARVPQTCNTRYSMNNQQTCDSGFSLDKGYIETMQGLSKLDELAHGRDQDLVIGFGNSGGRPSQGVATDFLWRATEGNVLPGGLMNSSSSQGQSSSSYQAFDFLSDKGGNDPYAANEKFDNISSFEGLRSTNVEPMEFSFMTTQESNAQLGHQKILSLNAQMDQGFGSSVWHQKSSLPSMMAGHVVTTLCVWCGNEFHQDSLGCEMQAGSIGYLCPTCKTRMAGQFL